MLKHIQTNFRLLANSLGLLLLFMLGVPDLRASGTSGGLVASAGCAQLFVDISTACLVPCEDSDYFVRYCNIGDTLAEDAYIEIVFDGALTVNGASIPFSTIGTNAYSFQVGDLQPGQCGSFSIGVNVDCGATPGQAHCVEAHIFPDVLCNSPSPQWDGSDIEVEIECQGDSIIFNIENVGSGDMAEPGQFFIIEDDVIVMLQGYQLNSGSDTVIVIPNNETGYHFEATQSAGNPSGFFASATIEGCDDLDPGFLNQFSQEDLNPAIDNSCIQNTPTCISNLKLGFPEGFGPGHELGPNLLLEFQINFENPTNDTVVNLTVCDTLSLFLDISTVLAGASSHDYVVEFPDSHIVKLVFENILLPPNGTGFVKFNVYQETDNPTCPPIYNTAFIYFDTITVQTDTIFYNEGHDCGVVTTTDTINICGDEGFLGIPVTGDTTISLTNSFSFFTSTLTTSVQYFDGPDDVTETYEICEGETIVVQGQVISSSGTYTFPMMDEDGCPYNLIVIVTVLENNETILNELICFGGSYEFFGEILEEPGFYSHVVPNDTCYDITILNLSFREKNEHVKDTVICEGDSIIWQGLVLDSTISLSFTFTDQFGCDSTETLNLTVGPHQEITIDTTICEGDVFMVGDSAYTEAGSYLDTIPTVLGCDSIVLLNLSLLPHRDSSFLALICEGETFPVGNTHYSESGIYIDTLSAANGCDSVVTLQLVVQSKDSTCMAEAGSDTIICGYSFELVGTPSLGSWEASCTTAPGEVALGNGSNGQASVTVSECGSYDFVYTYFRIDSTEIFDSVLMQSIIIVDTCVASDLVTIGFEDPSKRVVETNTEMSLEYDDYGCHDGDIVTCENVIPSEAVVPVVLWKFNVEGSCLSEIYSTAVTGSLNDCVADGVNVSTQVSEDSFNLPPLCLPQSDFVTLGPNGEIIDNNFLEILATLIEESTDSFLNDCPPAPPACFPPPPCEVDTLGFDTSYLEIPVRTGGQWTYLPDSATIVPLADTTDLIIDNVDYRFIIDPNTNTYSPVEFSIWEILPNDSLQQPGEAISITLQWQEIWVYDTIEIISPVLDIPDSCQAPCARGDIFSNLLGSIPLPPEFECSPFTLTFGLSDLEVEVNILCDTSDYQVELFISGGTPPYEVIGLSGSFQSVGHFISDPIPGANGFSAEIRDSAGCVKYVEGYGCPCVELEVTTFPEYDLSCIDSCVTMTAFVTANIPYYEVEWWNSNALTYGEVVQNCEEGNYLVRAFDPYTGCDDETTTEANFHWPEADAGDDQLIDCVVTQATLYGNELSGDSPIAFSWAGPGIDSVNQFLQTTIVGQPGMYELTVMNTITGCADMDTVMVEQDGNPPTADAGEDARFSCDTESMSLDGSGSSPGVGYSWETPDGNILSGETSPAPAIDVPGTYILYVTDGSNGCIDTDTVLIDEYVPVTFDLNVHPDCVETETGGIDVVEVDGFVGPYIFSVDSVQFQIASIFENLSFGLYNLIVRDTNGCDVSTDVSIVEVPALPELELDETYHFCGEEDTVVINAAVDIDSHWVSYFWSNGTGQPAISINEQGLYGLEISTLCEVLEYEFELVDDLANAALFEVPNVFTPDDNGINDTFLPVTPETNMPARFEMLVFDRWGNKIYDTKRFDRPWDGTYKGEAVPVDVYLWKVFASFYDCKGELRTYATKGNVTLMR
ncbi:MAG: gliding motility-associated C-terminal domain-containing protein [Bacteroidota bacterium]